jgi:hypothetical protein
MSKAVCEKCWMLVGDATKHDWEEHGVAPSEIEQARLVEQGKQFRDSLRHLDVEMVGEVKKLAWGGVSK